MAENNSKLLLSGKFDSDPEEILDKSLLFNLKKTSVEKHLIWDLKNLHWASVENNAFRIRKDPKQAEKDELKTMLETINRGYKKSNE